jgi:oxaloacetate decarboxylase alpha subunit
MMDIVGDIPFELHSHCTTGLAPLVYLEAIELGVETLHTGIPPLAEGSAQPSVLNIAANARLRGHNPGVDETLLQDVSERLYAVAREDDMVLGEHLEYDYGQFVHQIPGGVISNLKFQLAEIGLDARMDEVIEETIQIRQDLGYPIMITPFSQYMCTQAALNVSTGERYKVVIDELIRFAQGAFGEDSGAPWMDQNLKDQLLANPRAAELTPPASSGEPPTVAEYAESLGLDGATDEELLMHTIMQGDQEINAMNAAGAPKQYLGAAQPLKTLMGELGKHPSVRYVQVQKGADKVVLRNAATG